MRVLLDECVPRKLCRDLKGHECRTVGELGWHGTKNGNLLRRAAEEYDVVVTVDANVPYQQNVRNLPVALIVLVAVRNALPFLRPLVPDVLRVLDNLEPGRLYIVEDDFQRGR